MKEINITVVGHSGSGKTCYLYGMYARMVSGINHFTFIPEDYDTGLQLDAGWRKITQENQWPDGSIDFEDFNFILSHAYKPLFKVGWYDYRGSLLTVLGDEERPKFMNRLSQSAAILLFIDAETIKGLLDNDPEAQGNVGIMSQIIQQYSLNHPPIPLALVITKMDLLSVEEVNAGVELLRRGYLQALFMPSGGWNIIITRVGLGSGLTGRQGEGVGGTISPENIHLPILFPIYNTLKQVIEEKVKELENLESLLSTTKSTLDQETSKGWWKRFWYGDQRDEYQNQIKELKEDISLDEKELESLSANLKKIEMEFQDESIIFIDGQRMRFTNNNE